MLTKEEYKRIAIRIFDSIRYDSNYLGSNSCDGVHCEKCPFESDCDCNCFTFKNGLDNVFNTFAILEQWNKEHPIVTYEDKYVETFGVRPVNEDGEYLCPSIAGFANIVDGDCSSLFCDDCCEKFWKSKYIPPKQN